MSRSESEVQQLIMIEGPHHDCVLMRNNVGVLKGITGRPVRYGLNNTSSAQNATSKSSDLIGITTVMITEDMVGTIVGVFTACEVKKEGWKFKGTNPRERAQFNFMHWVKTRGGIANFCNSVEEFKKMMER